MPRGIPRDLTGEQFGSWTVLRRLPPALGRKIMYLCRCDCGNEVPVQAGNLVGGHSTRCRICGNQQATITRWGER